MIGRFFHTPTPKKFSITPRWWDPDKEERENRERRIKEELGIKDETGSKDKPYRQSIKGSFRQARETLSRSSENARKKSNKRLIILILILTIVFYLFFYSNFTFF